MEAVFPYCCDVLLLLPVDFPDGVAIGFKDHGALDIRAMNPGTYLIETSEDFLAGMIEAVVPAAGNNGVTGANR